MLICWEPLLVARGTTEGCEDGLDVVLGQLPVEIEVEIEVVVTQNEGRRRETSKQAQQIYRQ